MCQLRCTAPGESINVFAFNRVKHSDSISCGLTSLMTSLLRNQFRCHLVIFFIAHDHVAALPCLLAFLTHGHTLTHTHPHTHTQGRTLTHGHGHTHSHTDTPTQSHTRTISTKM